MKRKVIQIANSTQLISLPREWAKKHGIMKGQEMDVEEEKGAITIRPFTTNTAEKAELDISQIGEMTAQCIKSLYTQGVDELKVTFSKPESLKVVQDTLSKDVAGFEILEQGPSYCIIKSVSGSTDEFEPVLKRTFLLLLSMADEFLSTLNKGDYEYLNNVAHMEQTNNRFTMILRRHMNKNGRTGYEKTGPLYSIIEFLENISDHYKHSCRYLNKNFNRKLKLRKEAIELVSESNHMIKAFYELFYNYDEKKLAELKQTRNTLNEKSLELLKSRLNSGEIMLIHHSLSITQQVFSMTGQYLTIRL